MLQKLVDEGFKHDAAHYTVLANWTNKSYFVPVNSNPKKTPELDQLVDCFEQVFQIQGVTPEDDFFELGGDSLAAAQLMVEIEKKFGVSVPSTIFIEHPKVSALAGAVSQKNQFQIKAGIVPIKPSGNAPPVYMLHGFSGGLWVAQTLAPHLAEYQPLYGISPDLGDMSFTNFQELAEANVKTLLTEHPQQDYQLIGYSLGGILAYEMARQLIASGYSVSFLGLIDSRLYRVPGLSRSVQKKLAELKNSLRQHGLLYTISWSAKRLLHFIASRLPEISKRRNNDNLDPEALKTDQQAEQLFRKKAVRSLERYVPGPYTGDITIFLARMDRWIGDYEVAKFWTEFTSGRVNVVLVEGSHQSISRNPDIQQIAEFLNQQSTEKASLS